MATLEKIRGKAGLLVITIGLALFAFIIGDLFRGGETFWRQSQDKVITINGEKITSEVFQNNVEDLSEIYKMQLGQNSLPAEYQQQVNNQVYENIVNEALITAEAAKIGMTVSKEELADLVTGDHISPVLQQLPFFRDPQTGAFDKESLINFVHAVTSVEAGAQGAAASQELAQARKFWLFWEKSIKQQRLEDKFTSLLSKAIMPNKLDVQAYYDGGKTSVDFSYAVQSLNSIPDSLVSVSNSEIKALYDRVKDARYKQGETRAVKYFSVDIVPSEEDYKAAEEEINKAREEFVATNDVADFVNANSEVPYVDAAVAVSTLGADEKQFVENGQVGDVYGPYLERDTYKMYRIMGKSMGPESIQARHIMLPIDNIEASLATADSLMQVCQRGGDFAALAEQFSIDRNSASNGGQLGWFTEVSALRGLGDKFKEDCFAARLNQYFVCQSLYGVHLVQVTEQTAPVAKAKVAEYAQTVGASSRTFQKLYSDVNTFVAKNNTAELIEKNASEAGFNLMTQGRLTTTDTNLGLIQNARQAVRWAFLNDPGKISEVFELDNKFVVVIVTGETPAGYTPLAQVEPALRYELLGQKKGEKIVADLKAKNLGSLEAYAEAMNSNVGEAKFVSFNTNRIAGIGNEPVLCGIAPYAAEGQLTGPVAGNNGVYVFTVTGRTESETPFNAADEKRALENNLVNRLMYQSLMVLRNHAEIEDFRMNMY